MNSRIWVNIGLLTFLASTIFIFLNQNNINTIQLISSLKTDLITVIHIPRDQKEDIIFKKHSDSSLWYMTQPYQIKAHQFRIKTLLNLTQTPVSNGYSTNSLTLSDYALSPPRARILFNSTEIAFGKTNPMNNKRYLLTENKIFLVKDMTYPLVSAQPSSFVDLSLLPDNFSITKIQTPTTSIQLNDNGQWLASDRNKLNADQIQSLLQHWKSSQAFAVHKFMPGKNIGKIEISSNKKTIIFEITDDDPWIILASPESGIEYHLDKSLKNILYGIIASDSSDA